jgi:carbamoyltransferase
MYTLGINAAYHDSSACLVRDGVVVAASEDERFTHRKHAKRPVPFSTWELPFHAIDDCLRQTGIVLADVDHVAYSYDPFLLLGRHRRDAGITLPLEPSAHPVPGEWEAAWDPLFLSSIVNAPGSSPTGPRTTSASGSGASGPTARSAGISSPTTWRTPSARSTSRRSSGPPC